MKALENMSDQSRKLRTMIYEELSQSQRDSIDSLLDSAFYTGVAEGLTQATKTMHEVMARTPIV